MTSRVPDDGIVRVGLLGIGIYLISFSVLMLVSPGTFYEEIGPFNGRSDHYIRDGATFQMPFGILALIAARRRSWRLPVLVGLLLNFAMHSINHLADIDEADPDWLGPADFAGLVAGTALIVYLIVRVRRAGDGS